MRRILTFILLLFSYSIFSQTIDRISSGEEALALVRKLDTIHNTIEIFPVKPMYAKKADTLCAGKIKVKDYEKADFDNNGHTDLLFNGYQCGRYNSGCDRISLVVLSFGEDSFQLKQLSHRRFNAFFAARIFETEGRELIIANHAKFIPGPDPDSFYLEQGSDTLQYVFGNFIELGQQADHRINKLVFRKSGGFSIPIVNFEMTITPDSSWFREVVIGSGESGTKFYHKRTAARDWAQLTGILHCAGFRRLKENYQAPWTCDATSYMIIEFDDGKKMEVEDYGSCGTFGLEAIFRIIDEWRETASWILTGRSDDTFLFF